MKKEQPLIIDIENIKCQVRTKEGDLVSNLVINSLTPGEYIFFGY